MIHYTTIGQSKKLIELGLDPLTSDMCYSFTGEHIEDAKDEDFSVSVGLASAIRYNLFSYRYGYDIPCWSLGALLEVMPDGVQTNSNYTCVTIDITFVHNAVVTGSHRVKNNTYIEAAYNMVVWLLENGYIQKGE